MRGSWAWRRPATGGASPSPTHPMPRMTNTYMLAGGKSRRDHRLGEEGPLRGQFRRRPGRHHLGKFVFSASEAYLIENGKIGAAGQGRDADRQRAGRADKISMIGNDMKLDEASAPAARTARRAGWRRPADPAHGRPHRRRHRRLNLGIAPCVLRLALAGFCAPDLERNFSTGLPLERSVERPRQVDGIPRGPRRSRACPCRCARWATGRSCRPLGVEAVQAPQVRIRGSRVPWRVLCARCACQAATAT